MEELAGREYEKGLLMKAFWSPEAELIAIYGRRRVGKTFLVRSVFKKNIVFEFSGIHNATMKQQLQNFSQVLQPSSDDPLPPPAPKNWFEAFHFYSSI